MKTFAASEAKNNFGLLTDSAMVQPVSITRHGRVILEVMTPEAKEAMVQTRIKEFLWTQFIDDAQQSHMDYQNTGLHTNFDEMKQWVDSFAYTAAENIGMPECHK